MGFYIGSIPWPPNTKSYMGSTLLGLARNIDQSSCVCLWLVKAFRATFDADARVVQLGVVCLGFRRVLNTYRCVGFMFLRQLHGISYLKNAGSMRHAPNAATWYQIPQIDLF